MKTRDDEVELTAQFRAWHGQFPALPAIWGGPDDDPHEEDADTGLPPQAPGEGDAPQRPAAAGQPDVAGARMGGRGMPLV